jgi:hypothetical protein
MHNQISELQKVKDRIKALTKKTVEQGCSEHEAMVAMEKVGRLLEQYNLSMSEIDLREQTCKTVFIKSRTNRRGAMDDCVSSLASLFDCIAWFSKNWKRDENWKRQPSSYGFFGTETDIEMIEYLFNIIADAIENETANFKRTATYYQATNKKRATVSFGRGMASRISYRLSQMKAEAKAKQAAATPTGTSLVVLKDQLVKKEFKNTGIKLGRAPTRRYYHDDANANAKGREAGDKVNLSRPIGNDQKVSGYLS